MPAKRFYKGSTVRTTVECPVTLTAARAAQICVRLWHGYAVHELSFRARSVCVETALELPGEGPALATLQSEEVRAAVMSCFEGEHTTIQIVDGQVHIG